MKTKQLVQVYKTLFETWRFQVNSHWQRSSYFAAFETVALAACWKLFTDKPDTHPAVGFVLVLLGCTLTGVWYLTNNRTHEYALYWLKAVGEIETMLMKGRGEQGIDFAKKILDDKRSTIKQSKIGHRYLERSVPLLFLVAWIALFLFGICHLPAMERVAMYCAISYGSVPLAIAIASLLASVAAASIAKSSLSQAKRVADRDHKDWKQRKWFELYFKADEAYDALDRFQVLYPNTSSPGWSTAEWERESHDLMRVMRTVHRIALVFPQNPEIKALFDATAAFENMNEATSKDRLSKIFDAVEGIRQKALIFDATILD
jgi:hypothetical protein